MYVFQTIIYAGTFGFFYLLLLKDKPLHRFNRMYLLAASLLPLLLPLIKLDAFGTQENLITKYTTLQMPEITISDKAATPSINSTAHWVLMGYLLVTFCFITVNIVRGWQLKRVINKAAKIKTDAYTLLINTGYGPGSWNHYIFLPEADADERILAHEAAHIFLKHSKDLIFINILQCIFWYNPFLYFIKKELRQVHEFEADAAVKTDKISYQELLLHHFFRQCLLPFTHSFINHPIKRRIMMLNKNNQSKNNLWRVFFTSVVVLFFAGNIIWLQSCKPKNEKYSDLAKSIGEGVMLMGEDTSAMWDTCYVHSVFNGIGKISADFDKNFKYPEFAKKNNIEGRVTLRFKVDKKGNIVEANILYATNDSLGQYALDHLKSLSPIKMQPDEYGKTYETWYTLPVSFKLDDKNNNKEDQKNSKTARQKKASEEFNFFIAELKSMKDNMRKDIKNYTENQLMISNFIRQIQNEVNDQSSSNITEWILDNPDPSKENGEQTIIKESEIQKSIPSEYEATKRTYNAVLHPFGSTNDGC